MLRQTSRRLFVGGQVADTFGGNLQPLPGRSRFVLPVTDNLLAWYDASDTETITESSGAVSDWNDKSGNGHHLAQTTAGKKPTTGTRSQNGRNVLDFDGGDTMTSSCPTDDGSSTWFVVALDDTGTSYRPLIGSNGGSGGLCIRFQTAGGTVMQVERDSVAALWTTAMTYFSTSEAFGVAVRANSGVAPSLLAIGSSAASNDRTDSNNGSGALSLTATRTLYVGSSGAETLWWNGWIGEIIVYSTALRLDDMYAVFGYLQDKWAFSWS